MSIKKNITIDGMEVPFKASAAVPRLYRLKFHRDIYKDFASLKTDVEEGDENKSELDIESLEVFDVYLLIRENLGERGDDFKTVFAVHRHDERFALGGTGRVAFFKIADRN